LIPLIILLFKDLLRSFRSTIASKRDSIDILPDFQYLHNTENKEIEIFPFPTAWQVTSPIQFISPFPPIYSLSNKEYKVDIRPINELFDMNIRQDKADIFTPKRVVTFKYSTKGLREITLLDKLIGTPISCIIARYCSSTNGSLKFTESSPVIS